MSVSRAEARGSVGAERSCGPAVDTVLFDDSRFVTPPSAGQTAVLAEAEVPAWYCGVLEYFSQFTDELAQNPSRVVTPGLRWSIELNNRPLAPYQDLGHVLNPWGYGSFRIAVPLREGSRVRLVIRGVPAAGGGAIGLVGGRLVGRYWFAGGTSGGAA